MLPAGVVTTHTVFCLKDLLDDECQEYLCGILNSFVANYLVRMRVSTHVTSGIIDRLPVPVCHATICSFVKSSTSADRSRAERRWHGSCCLWFDAGVGDA